MDNLILSTSLKLERCPHCGIARPLLHRNHQIGTNYFNRHPTRMWGIYVCSNCEMIVTAFSSGIDEDVYDYFPKGLVIGEAIPERPKSYLNQAKDSLHAPAGAIMLAASAIDSMLRIKNYKDGNLKTRIEQAAKDHLITDDMSKWAHVVRLEANNQRHADENEPLPTADDARRVIDFAMALGQILFVLPAQVQHGLKEAKK